MRTTALFGIMALTLAGGCALVYGYGDYEDQAAAPSCTTSADCPGATECGAFTCVSSLCQLQPLAAAGVPISRQTPGDCQALVCDDAGRVVSVEAADDFTDDGNECTIEACVQGATVHENAAANTPCGDNMTLRCDGNGACAGCTGPSECGDDTCTTWSCVNEKCSGVPLSQGTDCGADAYCDGAMASPGDVCNGEGACIVGMPYECGLYTCRGAACDETCFTNDDCVRSAMCIHDIPSGTSSCTDCTSCDEIWENGQPDPGVDPPPCPGSPLRWEQLRLCACGQDCMQACGNVFSCAGANSGDPAACLSCLENACADATNACMMDTGHGEPAASP